MSDTPTIYMIRHAEKPPADEIGLSQAGQWRAEQLPGVFGPASGYNIKFILAEKPKDDGKDARPDLTVTPLASSLELEIDTKYKREEFKKIAKAVSKFEGPGNVLICWEHHALTGIATELGVQNAPEYDGDHFDYLWTLTNSNTEIVQTAYSIPPDPNPAAAASETQGSS